MTDNITQFDIAKRQESSFLASVENAKQANDAVKVSQNWLLVLGLAEMSFLGTLLLQNTYKQTCLIKSILVALLLSFCFFIIASVMQYKHLLKSARKYQKISDTCLRYLEENKRFMDELPSDVLLPEKQLITNKWANYLFSASLVLIIMSTLVVIFLIVVL